MSNSLQLKMDPERIREMPMVDLAFAILKAANTPFYYLDLMKEVAKLRGLTDEEVKETVAQLYTEINIDGRFACVGTNLWGLKRWYPIDRSEDPISSAKRPRIINDDDDDEDDAISRTRKIRLLRTATMISTGSTRIMTTSIPMTIPRKK